MDARKGKREGEGKNNFSSFALAVSLYAPTSGRAPALIKATGDESAHIPAKLRFEYIGFGKIIWYQQKVSTHIVRVPRTYVVRG